MKKILIFMVLLLTVFLSGCYYNDLEKFEKMMEIPMDSNYIIYEVDGYDSGYLKNSVKYKYSDILREQLVKDNKKDVYPAIDKVYRKDNKLYLCATYNTIENENYDKYVREYIIGYFDLFSYKYTVVTYTKNTGYKLSYRFLEDYFCICDKNNIILYDYKTDQKINDLSIESKKYKINEHGIIIYDNYNIEIYNKNYQKYNIIVENGIKDLSVTDIYDEYIKIYKTILKDNIEKEECIVINYKTSETITEHELYNIKQNDKSSGIQFYVDDDEEIIKIDNKEIILKMEELRQTNKIINDIELLFETELRFITTKIVDDEIFIIIGNTKSFFGAYSSGCTYPLIFKLNTENLSLDYIGCFPSVHSGGYLSLYKIN